MVLSNVEYQPLCRRVKIRLGAVDPAGQGQLLAIVLLDCATAADATLVAEILLAAQNGTQTMASAGMPVYFADTKLELWLSPMEGPRGRRYAQLCCGRPPGGLTYSLIVASPQEEVDLQLFEGIFQLQRQYTVAVGVDGLPDFARVDIVKYSYTGSRGS
ncbi:MAG: hypothetical protein ACYC9Q_03445 [Bacillota bacterium]